MEAVKHITSRQKEVLKILYDYIKSLGFPPSFGDLKEQLGINSNQSLLDLLHKLEERGCIKRLEGQARGIKILPLGYKILDKNQLVPVVGESSAGQFIEVEETFDWMTLPGAVLENEEIKQAQDEVFIIKVHGDSMINAGIDDGDSLLVKKTHEFHSGDIVVARSDDGTTVKRFIAEPDGRAYLKPENPVYKNIPIFEETVFDGKVISNLSKVK